MCLEEWGGRPLHFLPLAVAALPMLFGHVECKVVCQ